MIRSVCPVVAYVCHHDIDAWLRHGWMALDDLGSYHGQYSILMGWPCKCKMVTPVKNAD
jgi:hypothetical protein